MDSTKTIDPRAFMKAVLEKKELKMKIASPLWIPASARMTWIAMTCFLKMLTQYENCLLTFSRSS